MPERTQRRTYKSVLGFFFGFLLFQGVFIAPLMAEANANDSVNGTFNPTSTSVTTSTNGTTPAATAAKTETSTGECGYTGWSHSPVKCILIPALDALQKGLAWIAGGAAGLFIWVVDPANISGPTGILNKGAIYDLWRFIRDFFNLFFILILLMSAFATIFQLESFSIRKIFLNILFAALIINFSFPITRFLIDLTNVPMYYFLNSIIPGVPGGEGFVKQFLGSSGMGGIIIAPSATFSQAFMGVIFMFLFTISLLVLGVLMLIRLVALTLLLVFSPFGFAATLLPGMQDLGRKWWAKFWNYAFFGPAAALILLVAIRFQNEIGKDGTFASIRKATTEISAGSPESSSIALITFYTIPIILIWTAIGMANSFSIAGAGKVVGMGEGAARKVGGWAKKGSIGGMKIVGKAVVPTAAIKGAALGAKEGLKKGQLGGRQIIPKYLSPKEFKKRAETSEAIWKGRLKEGTKDTELQKLHSKRVSEEVKENKENKVSRSVLRANLESKDIIERQAAAISMAEEGELRTGEDLKQAILALRSEGDEKNPKYNQFSSDMVLKAIDKAKDGATTGITPELYEHIVKSDGGYRKTEDGKGYELDSKKEKIVGSTLEALDSKLKKDGNVHVKVEYKIKEKIEEAAKAGKTLSPGDARYEVYEKMVFPMGAEDLIKQTDLHTEELETYFKERLAENPDRIKKTLDKAMEKGKPRVQEAWMDIAKKEPTEVEIKSEEDKKKAEEFKAIRERIKAKREETRRNRTA